MTYPTMGSGRNSSALLELATKKMIAANKKCLVSSDLSEFSLAKLGRHSLLKIRCIICHFGDEIPIFLDYLSPASLKMAQISILTLL